MILDSCKVVLSLVAVFFAVCLSWVFAASPMKIGFKIIFLGVFVVGAVVWLKKSQGGVL